MKTFLLKMEDEQFAKIQVSAKGDLRSVTQQINILINEGLDARNIDSE